MNKPTLRFLLALILIVGVAGTALSGIQRIMGGKLESPAFTCGRTTGAVSHWPAEGNANDVADANNGSLENGATFATGRVGQAFSFDVSINAYVLVPAAANLNITQAITMEACVKPATFPNAFPTIMRRDVSGAGGDAQYLLAVTNTGEAHCNINKFADPVAGTVPLGEWTHIACTYDRVSAKIYINGVEVIDFPATSAIASASTPPLTIGKENGFNIRGFDGLIDEVRIFNRALTAAEVAADAGL